MNEIGKAVTKNIELTDDFNIDEEFAGFEKIEGDINDTAESIDNLSNSITQLGLDQLNVLGGSKGVSSLLEIDPVIEQGLQEYVANLDKVNMKAKEISKSVLEWAGFVYNAETQTWSFGKSLETTQEKIDYFGERLEEIFDKGFKNLFENKIDIQNFLSNAMDIGYQFINTLISSINNNMPQIIDFIGDIISTIVQGLGENLPTLIETIGELIVKLIDNLPQMIEEVVDISGDVVTSLSNIIEKIFKFALEKSFNPDYLKESIKNIFGKIVGSIPDLLSSLIEGLENALEPIFAPIGEFVGEKFAEAISKLFDNDIWVNLQNKFKGTFIEPIGNFFVNMINGIISGFENFINIFVKAINGITSGLSSVWTWLGIPAIPNLNEVKFNRIPNLGEQSTPSVGMSENYSSVTTSPSSGNGALTETFMEATVPMANAILQGNNEIVRTLKQQRTTLNVNGRELAEATYDDYQNVGLRKGKIVFNN